MRSAPLAVVGALIFDAQDRLLIQRRSAQRALFPNCWDIVGGHVEPGETPEQALHREVAEETGWRVARVVTELPSLTWRGDDGRERTEYDYVVTVDGDLTAPRLEAGKHTEFRWVGECELHLLLEHRTVDDALRQWVASLADAIRSGYAGRVAPLLDHAFASAMRDVAQGGGRELVASFGGRDLVGMLIEFRTALAWPGRRITVRQAEAVLRYRDLDECRAAIRHSAGAGFLELDDGFRAAARGMEFLTELYALHGRVTAARWAGQEPRVCRTAEVLGRVLTAAEHTGGDAWRAMAPPYEAGAGTGAVLLNRMGTLRYHRADAHAAAWQGAGLTAAGIVGLTGSPRDAIEAQTNRLAGPPFAVLTAAERATLLADLSALAG